MSMKVSDSNAVWGETPVHWVATHLLGRVPQGSRVCDVGARVELLDELTTGAYQYTGLDIYPVGQKTLYGDIEKGVELADGIFDVVVAVDVLEHTNDIEASLAHVRALTKSLYIINLPNELSIFPRLRLLFGVLAGKFKVDLANLDRHRWFFTADNVDRFVAQTNIECELDAIFCFYRRNKYLFPIFKFAAVLKLHSLFATSFLLICKKRADED